MSVFGNILHKIFSAAGAVLEGGGPAVSAIPSITVAPDPAPATPALDVPAVSVDAASAPAVAAPASAAAQPVDVGAVLAKMAAAKGGGGNYKTSIVDLLKLLDLDSSLDARKQLAGELGVHAGADGTAEQNVALQKAVLQKITDNGGTIPADMA